MNDVWRTDRWTVITFRIVPTSTIFAKSLGSYPKFGIYPRMKRTLLVVIDALASRVVKPAMDSGDLPNLQRLAECGTLREECVSIFPSITPAATASIATGRYPCDHAIAGNYFYNTEADCVRYFGTDFWAVQRKSFSTYFQDFLIALNSEVLQSPTLFQIVERNGRTAGCINYMIYRGDHAHEVNMPWLMKLWPGIPFSTEVRGPGLLYEGDFVTTRPRSDSDELSGPGGIRRRFGFQDETTAEVLLTLARKDIWPDFTLAYFPDNDFESHAHGPNSAVSTVKKVDDCLGELFEACGGLQNFLSRHAIVIVGDHSQSDLVADADLRGIDVADILKGFDLVDAGADWTDETQLMACPNMRACQFYLRRGYFERRDDIVGQLLDDDRIDQMIWWSSEDGGTPTYHVATAARGKLRFKESTGDADFVEDDFGNRWQVEGELSAIDAYCEAGRLRYADYPNALERIANCFVTPTGGDLWATAKPGYEFKLPDTEVQDAGSHGSLHALDSLAPLIAAGLPSDIKIPNLVRIVDVAPLCSQLLGVEMGAEDPS